VLHEAPEFAGAIERGKTPEGIRKVIERGKRIQAIQESQRNV
jgi:hypothetical protein